MPNTQYGSGQFDIFDVSSYQAFFAPGGERPTIENFPVAASQTLVSGTVVGLSSGNLVIANNSSVKPIGILAQDIATEAGQTAQVPVYRTGSFIKEALIWDPAYSTDALKIAAFRDVDLLGGTQIFLI